MGVEDKARNAAERAKGKVKETAGDATNDSDLENEGRAEQTEADLRQAGEKVKDAFHR
jgi:uncharacterized protein YjbJ (UPF0337 family)